jgi:IS1 family transposase
LTIQCDELWSFVDNKGNKQWVWLALDADTREIVGVYIGARDEAAARKLWDSLPPVYRQCAVAYTDFWAAILEQFFPVNAIDQWEKKLVKLAILNDSTIH